MLIGELINQVKVLFRLDSADSHLTDREVYSLIKKHRAWLIKRESKKNRILRNPEMMIPNSCIELIDVDITECCNISTCCTIKRSKEKLPDLISDDTGPLIGFVSSLDKELRVYPTTINGWLNKRRNSVFKYDKTLYYWIYNGYLYSPNVEWDFIFMLAANEEPVDFCEDKDECQAMQDKTFSCPDYLLGEMIQSVMTDLNPHVQIPNQEKIDKNENNK